MYQGRTVSISGDPKFGEWLCNNAMANRTCQDPTFARAVYGEFHEELDDCLTAWAVESAKEEETFEL